MGDTEIDEVAGRNTSDPGSAHVGDDVGQSEVERRSDSKALPKKDIK